MKTYVIDIADPTEPLPSSVAAARGVLEPGDRVHLFHHVFHARLVDAEGQADDALLTEAREAILASRQQRLGSLAALLEDHQVSSQVVWADNGWQALINCVKQQRADMLIAQSNRPTRWRPLARANDDWQLIRHCPVPLLLSRPECDHQYSRVLAAVDPLNADDKPDELDHRILSHASDITLRHDASLCVLNVATPSATASVAAAPAAVDVHAADTHVLNSHKERLADMVKALECDVSEICVIPGVPAQEIIEHANQSETDLLVMGAVSRSPLRNLLIGNTAEKVLDQVSADTLIIKPAAVGAEMAARKHKDFAARV